MLSKYACQLCNKSWTSFNSYNQHINSYPHQHRMDIVSAWSDAYCPPQSSGEEPAVQVKEEPQKDYQITTEVSFGDGSEKVTVDYTITEESQPDDDLSEEDLKFCGICRKHFTGPESARAHYESKKHQNKAYIAKSGVPTAFGDCQICGKYFTGTDQQAKHFASIKHLKKVEKAKELEENGSTEKVALLNKRKALAIRDFGECKLCSKFFTGADQATKHFASIKHLKKLAKSQEGEENELDPITTELIKPAVLTDQELVEIVKETIISYLATSVDRRHQRMLEEGTLFNCEDITDLLEKAVDYIVVDSFRCDLCKKSFTGTKPINDHLTSKKHQQKLAQAKALFADGTVALSQEETVDENLTNVPTSWQAVEGNEPPGNEQAELIPEAFALNDSLQPTKVTVKEETFEENYVMQNPIIKEEPLEDNYERLNPPSIKEKPYGDGYNNPNQPNSSERQFQPNKPNTRESSRMKRNFSNNRGRMSADSGDDSRELNPFTTQGISDFVPRFSETPAERGRDSRRGRGGQFSSESFRGNRGRGQFGSNDNFRGRGRKRRFFEEAPDRKYPRRN